MHSSEGVFVGVGVKRVGPTSEVKRVGQVKRVVGVV